MQIAEKWRFKALIVCGLVLLAVLILRLVFLQTTTTRSGSDFLQQASDRRLTNAERIPGLRGEIFDRNGKLLAYSSPTASIGLRHNIIELDADIKEIIASALELSEGELNTRLESHPRFVYLKRRMSPNEAESALRKIRDDLDIEAELFRNFLESHTEYKRFYPAAEVTAHVLGYTDVNDQGQEGIELAYDAQLSGQQGERETLRILGFNKRKIIGESKILKSARKGASIQLTIDLQVQSIAHAELKAVVEEHGARSASMVILDVTTGDILALVNQPSFNANDRSTLLPERVRNRALLDVFEPGSTVKPFTYAAGIKAGRFDFATEISTSPGYIRIDGHAIHDPVNYGAMTAAEALFKSSQVATAKLAMDVQGESLHRLFSDVGFGEYCATGFPGEQVGYLPSDRSWTGSQKAIFAYGYGLEVNTLQLARAYSVLADRGRQKAVNLVRAVNEPGFEGLSQRQTAIAGINSITGIDSSNRQLHDGDQHEVVSQAVEQVLDPWVANEIREVLIKVVAEGTGKRAVVDGYNVAGKTGTTHKVGAGKYLDNQYRATFAGMLPAENPQLVAVVTVENPDESRYYGGEVAAPVFSRVMGQVARVLNIAPDKNTAPLVSIDSSSSVSVGRALSSTVHDTES